MTPPVLRSILRPGDTCWRIAHADRMAVVIDGAEYFKALKQAILKARHSVLMIGWDFHTGIQLDREADQNGTVPNTLGKFLSYAVERNRELHVHILRWDLAFLKMPWRGTTPALLLNWLTSKRIHFRLDGQHPHGACHHQKIVVIDDAFAFCGGIDATVGRWDKPSHTDGDPHRLEPDGVLYGPWHDVTTALDGDAAKALGDLARDRWLAATGERLAPPPRAEPAWPDNLDPAFRNLDVAIARTWPWHRPARRFRRASKTPLSTETVDVREIENLYLAAIASARRSIYLESQYFAAPKIANAIGDRLGEPDGPEVIIINPKRADGWLEEEAMGSARAVLLRKLRGMDRYGRLRFATPVTEQRADIYVHAKVLVIDDQLLRIGSSNINNRSMGLDTECDLAVEVAAAGPDRPDLRGAILAVRDALLAEHLGVEVEELRLVLEATGSLIDTFDRLTSPAGRSLVRFKIPEINDVERKLAKSQALDPDAPEKMTENFVRAIRLLALSPTKHRPSWLTLTRKTI